MTELPEPVALFGRLTAEDYTLSAERALAKLRLAELAPPDRPYVVLNMVASADGQATLDGRAGPLGGEADRSSSTDCEPRSTR